MSCLCSVALEHFAISTDALANARTSQNLNSLNSVHICKLRRAPIPASILLLSHILRHCIFRHIETCILMDNMVMLSTLKSPMIR